jgi:hypothetical protein
MDPVQNPEIVMEQVPREIEKVDLVNKINKTWHLSGIRGDAIFLLENKMISRLYIIVVIFSILAMVGEVFSQWSYSLSMNQEFNSNPFRLPEGEEDQISNIAMGIRHDWSAAALQYYGSFTRFQQNVARNFYWHQLHLEGGDTTNWFINVDNRINRNEFEVYNYFAARTGLNHLYVAGKTYFRLGANANLNLYQNLSDINNILVGTYLSMNRSFQTRTSLFGTLSFQYKKYLETQSVSDPDTTASVLYQISQMPGQGGGGQGPGGGMGGGSGVYYVSQTESPSVAQLVLNARIAQSLIRYTGLAVQYQQRIAVIKQDRSLAGLIYGFDRESQIFDDPMGYQGPTVGIELTQILPWQFMLKGAGYYQEKDYLTQGIYLDSENFDETILRNDTYRTYWLTLSKTWNPGFLNGGNLGLELNYQWIDNNSNSYWYNYQNRYISAGIQLDL